VIVVDVGGPALRWMKGTSVRDVVFVAVTVGFFGLAAAYIGACARIIGREELVEVEAEARSEADLVEALP
jgi:hypothetical protein